MFILETRKSWNFRKKGINISCIISHPVMRRGFTGSIRATYRSITLRWSLDDTGGYSFEISKHNNSKWLKKNPNIFEMEKK
jgi:hypothetical protein